MLEPYYKCDHGMNMNTYDYICKDSYVDLVIIYYHMISLQTHGQHSCLCMDNHSHNHIHHITNVSQMIGRTCSPDFLKNFRSAF